MWLCNRSRFKKFKRGWCIRVCKKTRLKSDVDKLDTDKFKILPSNLSNLKSKVDKLDIGKLETTLFGLSKISNVIEM